MNTVQSPALLRKAISPTYYRAGFAKGRWEIFRETDGHVFCVCRSNAEADRLAKMLNQDCKIDPKHHGMK